MSFTLSILSANEILKEFFTVFKLNMHLNSRPKNKYTYSKQYNCKIGGRWLTSLTDNILLISVCVCVLVTQSCLTPCDPKDCSLPGSSVHGILQARILEQIARPFSMGSSRPKDRTSSIASPELAGVFFTTITTWVYTHEALHGYILIPKLIELYIVNRSLLVQMVKNTPAIHTIWV